VKYVLCFLILCATFNCSAQYQLTLIKDYCYDPTTEIKRGAAVKPLLNGQGYVIAGVNTVSNADATLTIVDNDFDILKQRVYKGSPVNDKNDGFAEVFEQVDGSFVCIGTSQSFDGDFPNNPNAVGGQSLVIYKVDSDLNLIWDKYYTCAPSSPAVYDALQSRDGGFIVFGLNNYACGDNMIDFDGSSIFSDHTVFKCDSSGNKEWAKVFGSTLDETRAYLAEDKANNIYLLSSSVEADNSYVSDNVAWKQGQATSTDFFVLKLNPLGDRLWTRSFGGSMSDGGTSFLYDSVNNELLVGGQTQSTDFAYLGLPIVIQNQYSNAAFHRLDTAANVLQSKVISGNHTETVEAIDFGPSPNTYLLHLSTQSRDTLDMAGYLQTEYLNNGDMFLCVIDDQNDIIMKYGINNKWGNNGGLVFYDENRGEVIINGGIGGDVSIECDTTTSTPFNSKFYQRRLAFEPLSVNQFDDISSTVAVYPNPASSSISFTLPENIDKASYQIKDYSGKLVQEGVYEQGGMVELNSLADGLYIIGLKARGFMFYQKLVIRN